MRIFPRFTRPSFKPVTQRWRRWRRHLSVPRVRGIVEGLLGVGLLLLTFGRRADFVWLLLLLAWLMALHVVVQRHLWPRIERYCARGQLRRAAHPVRSGAGSASGDGRARRARICSAWSSPKSAQPGRRRTLRSLCATRAPGDDVRRASSAPAIKLNGKLNGTQGAPGDEG